MKNSIPLLLAIVSTVSCQKEKSKSFVKTKYSLGMPLLLLVLMTLIFSFQMKSQDGVTPDVMPEYKGGIKNFYIKIQKSIKYPQEARKQNVQGQVFVSFTVTSKGRVIDIQADDNKFNMLEEVVVVGYVYESIPWKINSNLTILQTESERAIGLIGRFKPGKKDGMPIDTRLTIPITFRIDRGN